MKLRLIALLLVILGLVSGVSLLNGSSATSTNGFELRKLEFNGVRYAVVTLDLQRVKLQMRWKNQKQQPFRSFANLKFESVQRNEQVLAVMNAGIYDTNFSPLGLHIQQGQLLHALNTKQRGFGNFYVQPNGVFMLDKKGARVLSTQDFIRQRPIALEATQSGPMLVLNGRINTAFRRDSDNRLIRNGIGVESRMRTHLVLALDVVNFYDFAIFMRDGLKSRNALYLDGNVSNLNVPGTNLQGDGEYGGMLTVTAK